jgi:TonB-dependent SusC/RagA subfamily outer membrane receptor
MDNPAFAKHITVRITNANVKDALGTVLKGTGLSARLATDGETILVHSENSEDRDQLVATGTIMGRVTDSVSGHGLPGATVSIQGTNLTATTGDSGQFIIHRVPSGKQLVIVRLFGYRPFSLAVMVREDGQTTVNVILRSSATILSGVVTTATGKQKQLEVGNDIVVLNVDSLQRVAPITSVTDILESRVPGLTVLHSSGVPGDPARLRLRGPKSITGNNDPILIVDGVRVYAAQSDTRTRNLAGSVVSSTADLGGKLLPRNYSAPSPLDQLDPNSIETIEVLKGPSASALYGSDAANGVIVITTKHGHAGPRHWTGNVGRGISYLPGSYPAQYIRWAHGQNSIDVSHPCNFSDLTCITFDSITSIQLLNLPHWSPFRHGTTMDGSLTLSGGTQAVMYSVTGSGAVQEGYLQLPDAFAAAFQSIHGYAPPRWARNPDRYTTWGGNIQITTQSSPDVRFAFTSAIFNGTQQRSSLEQLIPALLGTTDTIGSSFVASSKYPIAFGNAYEHTVDTQLTFRNALTTGWAPWPWLPLNSTLGLSVTTGQDTDLLPRDYAPTDTLGHYGTAEKHTTSTTFDLSTTIPALRDRMRTAIGLNVYSQSSTDLIAAQDTLPVGVNTPSFLTRPTTQNVAGTTTLGWFVEPKLNISDRLYINPGFRLDGGNANGSGGVPDKLTFAALFPKVNVSYIALDRRNGERPLFGVLTMLRPRFAIGSAGVQPSPGDRLRLLGETGSPDILQISSLGNTQLKPERSSEVEGGLEADFWYGRASMGVTGAHILRHNAIINVPVAPSVLNQTISFNVAEVRNTSVELWASVQPIETEAISWSVSGNLSHNKNIVLRMDRNNDALVQSADGSSSSSQTEISIADTKVAVGYPLFGRWAKPIIGYADANHDQIIEENEIRLADTAVYLGRQDPVYTAAFSSDLALLHGQLGVHVAFGRQGGYTQLNEAGSSTTSFFTAANFQDATLGQQAAYEATNAGLTLYNLVQTVDVWQFQSLSVDYKVPTGVTRRLGSRAIRVALQGRNLGLWTNYRGKDPNVNAYPNGNAVLDGGQIAAPRTWELKISFEN